ncbi:MAG: isopenicillin N synthase family oxygenase [Alphaproteobacteria bacterium]|nr:isopenicillin N synthase family oxygenase [Alphaproteobacteria bacterium]
MIPAIDIGPVFGGPSPARDAADRAIMAAAADSGFMTVTGLPADVPIGPEMRAELLRVFALPDSETRKLWRQKFDPARPNLYRGWFPVQQGEPTYKLGIDIGPDLVYGAAVVDARDPLCEATPLPPEAALPGWRQSAVTYYRAMERTGQLLMRAIARGVGLPETSFDAAFTRGISTLRLIHYPVRPMDELPPETQELIAVEHKGARRYLTGRAHVDSGFVTLLAQDGVEGLQARDHDGAWVDVPPAEGSLAINFGKVLEHWTGGRVKATEHRVISAGAPRCSIPFFFEPRVDAVIAPLARPHGAEGAATVFAPFSYGDHLWSSMMRFVEFRGLEHMRKPRGVAA